jgi:hypothetical protein
LSEIATFEFCPPPTPGSRGSPGRARPTQSAPAKVAVAASPADSKVDSSLEAIEARVSVRRLLSMFAKPQVLASTSTICGLDGVPHRRESDYVIRPRKAPKTTSAASS